MGAGLSGLGLPRVYFSEDAGSGALVIAESPSPESDVAGCSPPVSRVNGNESGCI